MKKIITIVGIIFLATISNAQPWNALLSSKKNHTFYEYQEAFRKYWEPYNVKQGKYIDKDGNLHKAFGWKQFKRWEYQMEGQIDAKTGKLPTKDALTVYKKWQKKNPGQISRSANWQSVGPNSSEGGYIGIGRINTIEFHPTDTNTYWVATPSGGLWRTTDNAKSWTSLSDNIPFIGLSDIAVPSDYETSGVIYIATGDKETWENKSVGILKSSDAGQTWNETGIKFDLKTDRMCSRLLIDPNDDNTIIAATSEGVFKTTDGGTNWNEKLSSEYFIDMEYKPGNFNVLYGATKNGRVYLSENGGQDWTVILYEGSGERVEIAVTPKNANIVYAVMGNDYNELLGIFKSENAGKTFSQVFDGTEDGNNLLTWDDGNGTGGQAWYDLCLAVSPKDENIVLVGGINTWISKDGGTNWELANHWYGKFNAQAVHADKHMLKYNSKGNLYECNDGGIYVSYQDGISESWIDKSNGIVNSQMYKIGVGQTKPDEYISGLQDNGTKGFSEQTWYDILGGDGMDCLIDYTDDNIQYGELYYGDIYRTTDKWETDGQAIKPSEAGEGAWVTPYTLDPNDHNIIYAGYADLWKSIDQGRNWTKISNLNLYDKIRTVVVAPSNPDVIYIADSYTIYKTSNGGANWKAISYDLPYGTINNLTVKNNNSEKIWVALGGYNKDNVYTSSNGGNDWDNISDGLPEIPVNVIVYNKLETTEDVIYIGTQMGIFQKKGNNDWVAYNNGLPNVQIADLEIYYDNENPQNSELIAGSYGRGLWKTPLELSGNFAPLVITKKAENISFDSAELFGTISNDFNSEITEVGFIVSQDYNLTFETEDLIKVSTTEAPFGTDIKLKVENLKPGKNYYFKMYAKNSNGIGLGGAKPFTTLCMPNTTFPFKEGFEGKKLPNCWTEEFVIDNLQWQFTKGNQTSGLAAHSGNYNALFADMTTSEDKTMLILPEMEFSADQAFKLSFWYSMERLWGIMQDELTVLYKKSDATEWTSLTFLNQNTPSWTKCNIALPNLSGKYQIAFMGNAKYGRGVMLDDILIDIKSSVSQMEQNDIEIFPNPTTDYVTIQTNGNILKHIKITDITGRTVYDSANQGKNIKINMTNFEKGTYIINIQTDEYIYSKQIILN